MTRNSQVIILGCGYTGSRLAMRLISRGIRVFVPARNLEKLSQMQAAGIRVTALQPQDLPQNARLVYSIPPLRDAEKAESLHCLVRDLHPRRLIYISSTSIYGNQIKVNENTPINTETDRARARSEEEVCLSAGPWSTLTLRPAAIYGPGRGVHERVRAGLVPRGTGSAITSRIHVDDLVRLIDAGLESDLQGAWPVADQHPCPTLKIAAWCAAHCGVPLNTPVQPDIRRSEGVPEEGRMVDGSAIFRALGVKILWASWKTGIPACLAEEGDARKSKP